MERLTEKDVRRMEQELVTGYGQSTPDVAAIAQRNLAVALHELRLLMRERASSSQSRAA